MEKARGCKHCGKELVRRQKNFCSRACRNRFYLFAGREQPHVKRVCIECSKAYLARRSNGKFCSSRCRYSAQHHRRMDRQGGRVPKSNQTLWKLRRREVLLLQSKNCWLCRKKIEAKFDLHHLDGGQDSKSPLVVALHPKCHNYMHGVSILYDGDKFRLEGKALKLLKRRGFNV